MIGQQVAFARVREWFARDRFPHSLLIEGPGGVGKRAMALQIAAIANCETSDGCGTCRSCRLIAAGEHPDVIALEPDPAKASARISVDQVREVIRRAGYHRYLGRHRVVIIDPADAMGVEAANALLKTLEEPLEGTHFILLTSRPQALLPTIRSRVQRLRLGAVDPLVMSAWLDTRGHGPVAERAARLAEGRPGLALSLAEGGLERRDQLLSELHRALGADLKEMTDWTSSQISGSRAQWTGRVEEILELLEDLVRDATLVGAGAALPLRMPEVSHLSEAWAEVLWPGGVTRCAQAIAECRQAMAANANGRLLLDTLLARLATELGRARRAPLHPDSPALARDLP